MSKIFLTKEQRFDNDCKLIKNELMNMIKFMQLKSNKKQKDLRSFNSQSMASRKIRNPLTLTIKELIYIFYELDELDKLKKIWYDLSKSVH